MAAPKLPNAWPLMSRLASDSFEPKASCSLQIRKEDEERAQNSTRRGAMSSRSWRSDLPPSRLSAISGQGDSINLW